MQVLAGQPLERRRRPLQMQGLRPTTFLKGDSFNSPEIAALRPFNYANSLSACQDCRAGKTNEQSVLDNTRYQGQ